MSYLFTSESVSEGHPDKVSDQISDSILDHILAFDKNSKVAIETLVTTGKILISGEIKSKSLVNIQNISRNVLRKIGYTRKEYNFSADSCAIFIYIQEQSLDIVKGLKKYGNKNIIPGDQCIVFGYAVKETSNYMPLSIEISHYLLKELSDIRKEGKIMTYLRPDSKSQVTLEYSDEGIPIHIHSIVISTQHDEFDTEENMHKKITEDIINIIIPRVKNKFFLEKKNLFNNKTKYYINSMGRFVIGGPHGDTGLTGRKIMVDTYGGRGSHGGGSFSGKDSSKMDRTGAYEARHIAKNLVAAGISDEILIQMSYTAGIENPINIFVETYGKSKLKSDFIAYKIKNYFDLRPCEIEKRLKLQYPIYEETSVYGHMGKCPKIMHKSFNDIKGNNIQKEVELFTWEKLDYLPIIKDIFHPYQKKF